MVNVNTRSKVVASLVHAARPEISVTVLRIGQHFYADDSRETELEWLGGIRSARDFVARCMARGGFVRVQVAA